MNRIVTTLPTGARLALGLIFLVFGLNGLLGFLPMPPMPDAAGAFMGALAATGYLLPLLKGTEITAAVLLLSGRHVPLALTLLAPIIVNIVAFHVFLAPGGLPIALVVLTAELYLAFTWRHAFSSMFATRSAPRMAPVSPTRAATATA